eukprot:14579494-Alexandrium_andersonii.AAC.1
MPAPTSTEREIRTFPTFTLFRGNIVQFEGFRDLWVACPCKTSIRRLKGSTTATKALRMASKSRLGLIPRTYRSTRSAY